MFSMSTKGSFTHVKTWSRLHENGITDLRTTSALGQVTFFSTGRDGFFRQFIITLDKLDLDVIQEQKALEGIVRGVGATMSIQIFAYTFRLLKMRTADLFMGSKMAHSLSLIPRERLLIFALTFQTSASIGNYTLPIISQIWQ